MTQEAGKDTKEAREGSSVRISQCWAFRDTAAIQKERS